MAFLGPKELNDLQIKFNVILPFRGERIKNAAYELSLGTEVFTTDAESTKVEMLNDNSNRQIDINPGQFALLLTAEKVSIPKNKIAFISIKAGEKLKGLVNVSGFHVDPGFNDHLLFSVYNAGPSTIVLNYGEPYFPIWFAELTTTLDNEQAYGQENEHFGKLSHIPAKYIESLKRGELTSPKALFDKIKEVEAQLTEKIVKSDEKKERNDWLLKILIGLLIAIGLKLGWDWNEYKHGYDDGKNFKSVQEQIRQEIKSPLVDSSLSLKIDSFLSKKIIHDTAKTTH